MFLLLIGMAGAVPAAFTTQGRLLDADGNPVEGSLNLSFRLLDAETGGRAVWSETQPVAFTRGYYSVVLGADEATNPLDDDMLERWPLWLEVQVEGQSPMVPRSAVGSVPYARLAGRAVDLQGGTVDARSVRIDGVEVIDGAGAWVGVPPTVAWDALSGMPAGFADGVDDDTLPTISCDPGSVLAYDASVGWTCGDPTASLAGVEAELLALSAGLDALTLTCDANTGDIDTLEGRVAVLESGALVLSSALFGLEARVASLEALEDSDVLAGLACVDGQIPVFDTATGAWDCGDDRDTTLSAAEVVAAVEAATGIDLSGELRVGGYAVLTTASEVAWTQLVGAPGGLSDGDDDTLSTLACEDGGIAVFSTAAGTWACGTDNDTTLTDAEVIAAVESATGLSLSGSLLVGGDRVLTTSSSVAWSRLSGVPAGLDDGDDDSLAATVCDDGEILVYNMGTNTWDCGVDNDTTLTASEVRAMVESVVGLALSAGATVDGSPILTDANHGTSADAHHSSLSAGLDIRPASVTIDGTSTSLRDGSIDLGSGSDDALTAAMVQTLTGGGNADALHTHAATGGGGACYTVWGTSTCASGYTAVHTGTVVYYGSLQCLETSNLVAEYGSVESSGYRDGASIGDIPNVGEVSGVGTPASDITARRWYVRSGDLTCAICCSS